MTLRDAKLNLRDSVAVSLAGAAGAVAGLAFVHYAVPLNGAAAALVGAFGGGAWAALACGTMAHGSRVYGLTAGNNSWSGARTRSLSMNRE